MIGLNINLSTFCLMLKVYKKEGFSSCLSTHKDMMVGLRQVI